MIYEKIQEGTFHARPNRFIAEVEIDGHMEICHVKNTGRCKELLVPGTKVYVNQSDNPKRVTKYDLISVWKGNRLINMDSQAPNKVFREYLESGSYMSGITFIRPETKYGNSRFDFYVETKDKKIFIEVKGVTLEKDGVVLFPDAPTERGVRHLKELAQSIKEGYEAHAVFVIQMKDVRYFIPNDRTHPAFGETLAAVKAAGVKVSAFDCNVTKDCLEIGQSVPIR